MRVVGQGCSGLLILFGAAAARACAAGGVVCVFWWAGSRLTCLKICVFSSARYVLSLVKCRSPPAVFTLSFGAPSRLPPTSASLGSVFSVVLFSVLEDRGLELERFFLS